MALGPRRSGQPRRDVLHDGAGAEALAPGQRRLVAARRGLARDVVPLFPGGSEDQVPIGHITNGVHVPTWLAPQMHQVYDRHLGPDWPRRCGEPGFWEAIERVDDGELWETHQTLKVAADRHRAPARRPVRRAARGESPDVIATAAPGAEPRRADDRLRAPLRHLQARQPDPPGHRGDRRAGQRSAAAGAVRVRRQGASARLAGQGTSCSRSRG